MDRVRLGIRQLELLAGLARYGCAMVVGDRQTRRLDELGLVKHHGADGRSFAAITPAGLRFIANAVEEGRLDWFSMESLRRPLPSEERR